MLVSDCVAEVGRQARRGRVALTRRRLVSNVEAGPFCLPPTTPYTQFQKHTQRASPLSASAVDSTVRSSQLTRSFPPFGALPSCSRLIFPQARRALLSPSATAFPLNANNKHQQ